MEYLGEKVEHSCVNGQTEHSNISNHIQNLYLPQMSLLVQTKLRIGSALARWACHLMPNVPNK